MAMPLSEQDRLDLLSLYKRFIDDYKKHPSFNINMESILSQAYIKALTNPKLLDKLSIALPLEEIKNLYDKTGVIVLRPPHDEKKLLLFCGNNPIEEVNTFGGKEQHLHPDKYTIDPDILMNPSIIAFFGIQNQRLAKVFDYFNTEKFEVLCDEGSNPIAENAKEINSFDYSFMQPNFKLIVVEGSQEMDEEALEDLTLESFLAFDYSQDKKTSFDLSPEDVEVYDQEQEEGVNFPTSFGLFKAINTPDPNFVSSLVKMNDIKQFQQYFTNAETINNFYLRDNQSLANFVFDQGVEASEIFAYICELQADLTIPYYGSSVKDEIIDIITHDNLQSFQKKFSPHMNLALIQIDAKQNLLEIIESSNAKNIQQYLSEMQFKH